METASMEPRDISRYLVKQLCPKTGRGHCSDPNVIPTVEKEVSFKGLPEQPVQYAKPICLLLVKVLCVIYALEVLFIRMLLRECSKKRTILLLSDLWFN